MQKVINIICVLGIVLSLSGCGVSSTGLMVAGPNTYKISHKEGAFPTSNGNALMQSAMKEATEYCESKNKIIVPIATHGNLGPYILGKFPTGSVTFQCTDNGKVNNYKTLLPATAPKW